MKLVMTLLARDEADIIADHLEYHLGAGVDFVIATDHRSQDGTSEILESYRRAGVLRRIHEDGEHAQQSAWQTRMARLAATEYRADWVINSDADEFWWPRGPSLKEVLGSVPGRHGVVRGLVRNFVPLQDDRGWFAERMTFRLATSAPINDPATPFRPVAKAAHRGTRRVVVWKGSHQVFDTPGLVLRDWYPLEVLHLPLRSRAQCAAKYRKTWTGWKENLRADLARAHKASAEGRPDYLWDRVALDSAEVDRGLEAGALISDTRLRDAMIPLRGRGRSTAASASLSPFAPPGRAELDAHVYNAAVFEEAEIVRNQRWLDALEVRLQRLEAPTPSRGSRVRSR